MLDAYCTYFQTLCQEKKLQDITFLVVMNGCSDGTAAVVADAAQKFPFVQLVCIPDAGKGLAIKTGFLHLVPQRPDLIGYVDSDMSTAPEYFYDLVCNMNGYDAAIASRYMPGGQVFPPRSKIKRWGSRLVYENLARLILGIDYYDLQCGAKLFNLRTIECIAPLLMTKQWACDAEILYLCRVHELSVKEVPTVWYEKAGSKLHMMAAGMRMLLALWQIHVYHTTRRIP